MRQKVYVIIDLQEGSGKPHKIFSDKGKAKKYMENEGYTERLKSPMCFFYDLNKTEREEDTFEEYDMIIYEEEIE